MAPAANAWGAIEAANADPATAGLKLKDSRAIITGGADNYEENNELYNQREFEEFSDNDSIDGDVKENEVRIGDTNKD